MKNLTVKINDLKTYSISQLHPGTVKHLEKGHPWITLDKISEKFPTNCFFLNYQGTLFLHDPMNKKIRGRFWGKTKDLKLNVELDFESELKKRIELSLKKRDQFHFKRQHYYLVFGEADLLPGIHIIKLDNHYIILSYTHFWFQFKKHFIEALPNENIWWQDREVQASKQTPPLLWNKLTQSFLPSTITFPILENNCKMNVYLGQRYDTGIYTDMASIRQKLFSNPDFSIGKTFLNLFSYTGIFSICALKSGALKATSIDLSKWANIEEQNNSQLNDIDPKTHQVINGDIFQGLQTLKKQAQIFDCIILDPPSSFTVKQKRVSIIELYGKILREILPLTKKQTLLYCFLNHHSTTERKFLELIQHELKLARVSATLQILKVLDEDCPTLPYFPEGNYLKCVVITF